MKTEMAIQLSVKPLTTTLIKICSAVLKLKQAEDQMYKHNLPHMCTVQRMHNKQNRKHSESSVTKVLQ